jgi:RimJ/RimL family protein N-acetyltransferase
VELLRTERLLLRRWEESDLPAFFGLYSREDVARWLGQHPRRALATWDQACERLRQWHVLEHGLDPPLGRWAIVPLAEAGIEQVIALTDPDNIPSQAVAARLGMRDEGITQRWYGLTSRQYHKITTGIGDRGPAG